jgi:aryl-alcohol dehydrogenase-like predicted oxidoreductase
MNINYKLGLGTFPFAGPFGSISMQEAEEITRKFVEMGGQYLDTAVSYGDGAVQTLIGEVVKEINRSSIFIGSYFGFTRVTVGKYIVDGKYSSVIKQCENALRLLDVEYIDLFVNHIPDLNTPVEETLQGIEKLQSAGKVIDFGVSNVTLSQLKSYNKYGQVRFLTLRYSLINQSIEEQLIEYCLRNKIEIIAYCIIRSMPHSESGVCRTPNPVHAAH